MKRVLFIVFGFLGIFFNQAPGQETTYDVEYTRVCLIDSIAPDTMVQFWRFSQANNPGGNVVDVTYDLTGAYTPSGTLLPCCSCLTAASDSAGVSPPGSPGGNGWIVFLALALLLFIVWLPTIILYGKRPRIAYFLPMALLFSYSSLSAQSETRYDIEFECICLVDSIGPGNVVQFYRFTQANNPGGNVVDVTYDLTGAYTPAGTVLGCNDYYLGDNVNTGGGTAGTLAIWTGTYSLGNSSVTESGGNVVGTSFTGAFGLAVGTTAQNPVGANGRIRYNTTDNGISAWNGAAAAWQYLPWADADNWAANQIPYSNGSALTSESDFAYNGSELSINMTDQGAYNLQSRGPVLFSNDGTNATGFIFTPSDRKITSALPNLGVVIEGNAGNSFTTIYGKSSIYLRVDVNSDNDLINFQNGSGSDYASFSGRLHYYKFGQANSTTAFTIEAFNNGNMAGKPLIIGGGQSVSSSGSFDGGKLFLRGGSGSAGLSPTSLPGNVEIGRYAVGGTGTYTSLSEWKLDTIYHYKYGTGAITGTHAYSAAFTSSGKLIEVPEKWASISTSTDGSGDIVVAHGMGVTPTSVQVTVTGTTPYVVTVHTIGATNFTVRFYDMTGAAVTSTAVTATWHAKT